MQRILYTGGSLLLIGLLIIFATYDPSKYSFFPKCPFHSIFGIDCPGCGSQRAIHALLTGNIALAINYNLLMVLCIPLLFVHLVFKLMSFWLKRDMSFDLLYYPATPKVFLIVVVVFWIARNIPHYPFSYLAA
ncbi:MAG: DUF2752 domain-containing protein [Pedobacter sp.]|nr:MAG: DUF2752 domain-containing protein [Pedobacter sp.]